MKKDLDHFLFYEEEFHGSDRKLSKEEKKIAIRSDRSQYKKTDQDKKKKQEADKKEEPLPDGTMQGRVLSIGAEEVQVDIEGSIYSCGVRGSLKKGKAEQKNLLAIGDIVYISPKEGSFVIFKIEPRRSVLSRADNLSQKKQQIIAANIDLVIITTSVVYPPLKPSLIDRYIIAAQKGNMQPILVINKIDLLLEHPEEAALVEECIRVYTNLGIPSLGVSVHSGEGLQELYALMQEKTSVFSGQSGTGKSSLINAMIGSDLKTGKVIAKTAKGSHTTTSSSLLPLPEGGFCVDTPGIRSFGVWDLSLHEIEAYFPEIAEKATQCRFPLCSHQTEEGCAVLEAVEKGEISPLRMLSYFSLLETLQKKHQTR